MASIVKLSLQMAHCPTKAYQQHINHGCQEVPQQLKMKTSGLTPNYNFYCVIVIIQKQCAEMDGQI